MGKGDKGSVKKWEKKADYSNSPVGSWGRKGLAHGGLCGCGKKPRPIFSIKKKRRLTNNKGRGDDERQGFGGNNSGNINGGDKTSLRKLCVFLKWGNTWWCVVGCFLGFGDVFGGRCFWLFCVWFGVVVDPCTHKCPEGCPARGQEKKRNNV